MLQTLGFDIPQEILEEVKVANTFYRHGLILKQICHFYNNMSSQMIQVQMNMLLEDAQRFEQIVRHPRDLQGKPIQWGHVVALEAYVKQLQEVSLLLTEKNRQGWLPGVRL
eukprot:TRINITY_DN230_c1_g4_i1.p5 TRINITY_DN230_c1_g4~~TRINITY_DN230_c1_g4_i1.p5  ORF type:complete len:111 (-),score=14.04 TRINITY_DN230_c1_g4_i1:56-388(-)